VNKVEITTERLRLRELGESDYPAFRALDEDERMHRFERPVPSPEMTLELLNKAISQAQAQPRTQFRMAITLLPDGEFIGRIKLALNWAEIREWEVGWAVRPDHWGHGYAPEAARAMIDYAFRELGAHRVVAYCHSLNTASTRVMEKAGMQREARLRQTRWWHENWSDEYLYGILETEWASGGGLTTALSQDAAHSVGASTFPPIEHSVYIQAAPERIYDLLVTGAGWDAWFTRGTSVEARPGGAIHLRWEDWGPDHVTAEDHGMVLEVVPDERFAFKWHPGDTPTIVTFELHARGDGTVVRLTESGYTSSRSYAGCATGWGEALTLLKFYLEYGLTYGNL
jgi:RimJ/RimL family protein N-acetyltransferase/uncharacterized protein YndB with AHSA1/START domain